MDRELKRGTLEMVLLRMLEDGDCYGYEMATEVTRRTGGTFELKEGTMYPVLYRLEGAGFIEPYWETKERGVPRKYYRITDSGRVEFARQRAGWESFVKTVEALLAPEGKVENDRGVRIGGR